MKKIIVFLIVAFAEPSEFDCAISLKTKISIHGVNQSVGQHLAHVGQHPDCRPLYRNYIRLYEVLLNDYLIQNYNYLVSNQGLQHWKNRTLILFKSRKTNIIHVILGALGNEIDLLSKINDANTLYEYNNLVYPHYACVCYTSPINIE